MNHCVNATSCPANTYGDPINGVCAAHCPSPNGNQMFADTNPNVKMCVYICPEGYYIQNISNNWTCVTTCLANYYIDYVTDTCVATCPHGSFSHTNGQCLNECPSPAFFANPLTDQCDAACTANYFADPTTQTCVPVCPHGYFGDTNGYTCVQTCTVAT